MSQSIVPLLEYYNHFPGNKPLYPIGIVDMSMFRYKLYRGAWQGT